ncbi:bh protein [Mesobacillus subterraneus]|uniref:Bh protein n=2 Tax=Mesobacillus TaxID=2675231 RepID=A0A0D6Z9Q4_9BACI|nr:hypothetical protein [Mesobacillus subterraneus]KIY22095.1 bh protein [Mesobacillus subterraneus]
MHGILYCSSCQDEVPHTITYINDKIKSVECDECNYTLSFNVDVMKEFYDEIYNKISTKPSRITEEYRANLSLFLKRLPVRIISKPYRVLRSLNTSRKIIKKYK